jgi:hypothetical protein
VKRLVLLTVFVLAVLIPDAGQAQRGMRLGGGSPRMGGVPMRGSAPMVRSGAGFGSRGVFIGNRGFVPINGFRNRAFVGGIGFGHNPRFHLFFGNPCFNNPFFCGGFRSGFFNSRFFPWGGFGFPVYYGGYGYPLYSDQYYDQTQAASPYPQEYQQGAYQQGVMAQQVQDLTNEVGQLRAEMASAKQTTPPYSAKPSVQELPLNATLVFRNGRRMQIHNYAIVGQTIWIFDEKAATKMSLAQLDLDATKRVNEENGVQFMLPGLK